MKKRVLEVGALSDKGDRKENNEDSIFAKTNYVKGQEIGIFIIADGMSGLGTGKAASTLTTDMISFWWDNYFIEMIKNDFLLSEIMDHLDQTISLINLHLNNQSIKSATTLSILIIIGEIYVIRHVGDTRIYLINKKILQLTEDHSYVAYLYKEGKIAKDDINFYSKRNVLTRCLGAKSKVLVYKKTGKILKGDIFLICSDGFYSIATEPDILKIIFDKDLYTMQDKVKELRKLIKQGNAYDNVSILLIEQINI